MKKQMQYSDADEVGLHSYKQIGNVGDGLAGGLHHDDADLSVDARFKQNNLINYGDSAAFNRPDSVTVNVDRADRGKES